MRDFYSICVRCEKIRNGEDYRQRVEEYITENTDALCSHGFCPDCYEVRTQVEIAFFKERLRSGGEESLPLSV